MSSAGHRADEDPAIEDVILHPHPVTKHCPAAEWTRRIDGKDPHGLIGRSYLRDKPIGQGALAGTWRTGEADPMRGNRGSKGSPQQHFGAFSTLLHQGDQSGQRPAVSTGSCWNERSDI